jgi:outer membrane protein TolC
MGAFDDPQIEVGVFTTPMATVDGKQIAEVKAMQMFPWFGTKKAAQNEAIHMANMARELWRDAQNELCRQVATQWVQLWLIQRKIKNTQQQKQLLLHLEQLAVHKLATAAGQPANKQNAQKRDNMNNETGGKTQQTGMNMGGATSSMPTTAAAPANNMQGNMTASNMTPMGNNAQGGLAEILQLQLQIAETENNNESLLSQFNAEKIKFNTLLNRYPQATVALPDSLQLPYLAAEQATHMPDNNPTLEMIKEEALALHAKESMNKKMGLPMIGVGVQYMVIGKNPTTNTNSTMDMISPTPTMNNMNGKDMIMPMVAITVPIYRNKHKAANKEIQLLKLANQQQYVATENQLNIDIALAKHLINDEVRKIKLYRKQVQLVKSTYELTIQAFANGQTNLDALITVQQQLLDYTLKHDQAVATFYTNNATLNKLIMSYELEYDEN